ncbi:MAG: hypothetical protein H6622_00575 [Halobacteriovoraceae bacterium]|nr:hypothetical protein [Halobacteriovoraceae bacterium]
MRNYRCSVIIFCLLILLNFVSCRETSTVTYGQDRTVILKVKDTSVKDFEIVDWKVGPYYKQEVSKGVRFTIQFPKLERTDVLKISELTNVDSWLVRISRSTIAGQDNLGFMYVPFVVPGTERMNNFRVRQLEKGIVQIFYSAASVSTRFERFKCPAFNHRKVIDEVVLEDVFAPDQQLTISPVREETMPYRVEEFSLVPNSINGGKSLIGEFQIEMAFYDSRTKTKKSNYIQLDKKIIVKNETNEIISGCEDFEPPPKPKEKGGAEQFDWNRKL